MPRKKAEKPPAPPKINAKDWRNLPTSAWNTLTVLAFFIEMNREKFGVEDYVPMRNYGFEQRQIKSSLDRYGPEVMREVFTQAFAEYRPTRAYPILTAGFTISFVASRLLPRILADKAERERMEAEQDSVALTEPIAW
jgi:hypothetical protein